jgi:hypothetical protein
MSKTENTEEGKVEVLFETSELLKDLEYDKAMEVYQNDKRAEIVAFNRVQEHRKTIQLLVSAVQADTVFYKGWMSTLVQTKPKKKLNMDKFMHNLMILGKLTADRISAIIAASEDTEPAGNPYIKITPPDKNTLPKRVKAAGKEE